MARKHDTFEDFDSCTVVAEMIGEKRPTLWAAVDAGHVRSVFMGTERRTRMVHIPSAREWAAKERKPGPAPGTRTAKK